MEFVFDVWVLSVGGTVSGLCLVFEVFDFVLLFCRLGLVIYV